MNLLSLGGCFGAARPVSANHRMLKRASRIQRLAAPALLVAFFLFFFTELDRELVRRGFPVPGVVLYAVCITAFAAWLLASSAGPTAREAVGHALRLLRRQWPFLLTLGLLAALTWLQWPRNPDARFRDGISLVIVFGMAASAMALPLASSARLRWRRYLGAAFLFYCCTVFIDVLWPGAFALFVFRAAGLAEDPNVGAYMVLILAAPLLSYRRFSAASLAVLFIAGFAVFMTLSRSGLLGYAILFAVYSAWTLWAARGGRVFAAAGFAAAGALLAAVCLLSIQVLPYFDHPAAVKRLNQLAGRELFTYTIERETDRSLWTVDSRLEEFKEYTKAVVAAEAAAEPPAPDSAEPSAPDVNAPVVPASVTPDDLDIRMEAEILGDNIRVTDEVIEIDVPRLVHLKNSWRLVTLSPVWGYGAAFSIQNGVSPHVMFLLAWVDLGVFGMLLYAAFLAAGFWIFIRDRFWPGVFLMGLVAYFSMFSQTILESRPLFVLLGLLMGLPLALRRYGDADTELPATEER